MREWSLSIDMLSLRFILAFCLVLLWGGRLSSEPLLNANIGKDPSSFQGELLISELGCVACHNDERDWKSGPRLGGIAERIQREYFINFVLNPEKVKPGTTMPNLLSELPEEERLGAASAMADYLWGDAGDLKLEPTKEEAVAKGKKLYHEVGCVACHCLLYTSPSPRDS